MDWLLLLLVLDGTAPRPTTTTTEPAANQAPLAPARIDVPARSVTQFDRSEARGMLIRLQIARHTRN